MEVHGHVEVQVCLKVEVEVQELIYQTYSARKSFLAARSPRKHPQPAMSEGATYSFFPSRRCSTTFLGDGRVGVESGRLG